MKATWNNPWYINNTDWIILDEYVSIKQPSISEQVNGRTAYEWKSPTQSWIYLDQSHSNTQLKISAKERLLKYNPPPLHALYK